MATNPFAWATPKKQNRMGMAGGQSTPQQPQAQSTWGVPQSNTGSPQRTQGQQYSNMPTNQQGMPQQQKPDRNTWMKQGQAHYDEGLASGQINQQQYNQSIQGLGNVYDNKPSASGQNMNRNAPAGWNPPTPNVYSGGGGYSPQGGYSQPQQQQQQPGMQKPNLQKPTSFASPTVPTPTSSPYQPGALPGGDAYGVFQPALNADWSDPETAKWAAGFLSHATPAMNYLGNQGQNAWTNDYNQKGQAFDQSIDIFGMHNTNRNTDMNIYAMLTGEEQWDKQHNYEVREGDRRYDLDERGFDRSGIQWDREFDHTQSMDVGYLGLENKKLTQSGDQFDRDLGLRTRESDRNYRIADRGMSLDELTGNRDYEISDRRLTQDGSQFDRSLDQRGSEFDRTHDYTTREGDRRFGLDDRRLTQEGSQFDRRLAQEGGQFDRRLAQEGSQFDRTLGQRGSEFDRTLGQRGSEFDRNYGLDTGRFGLETLEQREYNQFRNRQLTQDAEIARERLANDAMAARYAAFGRAQAPRGNWSRNW